MCSPDLDKILPPDLLPPYMPYSTALPSSVDVPIQPCGKIDVFTDDVIPVGLHSTRCKRLVGTPLLALHLLGCPMSKHEPLSRDDLVAIAKLQVEGQPSESKTALGWCIDTRTQMYHLPPDKHKNWSSRIYDMLKQGFTNIVDL